MAEVDTSIYKQPAPPGAMDVLGKVQGVEQQKLGIDQAKLNQINQGYSYLLRELNSLPSDATADQFRQLSQNAVKMRLITPEMAAQYISTIPTDPSQLKAHRDQLMGKLMSTNEAVNFQYGAQNFRSQGQQIQPTMESPRFGVRPNAPPIQIQEPPGTESFDEQGRPTRLGPQPPRVPVGRLPVQGGIPGQFVDPAAPMVPTAIPTTREPRLPVQRPEAISELGATPNAQVNNRFPVPAGSVAGLPPGEAAVIGGEADQLTKDRNLATERMTAALPMKRALALIPQTMTGIGAPTVNTIRAGLIQAGIITPNENDPTIIYQELNKALKNYVTKSGFASRSDEAQRLTASANPDADKQLNPALIRIARDAVAYDRIEAARAISYNGPVAGYGRHRSTFANSIDPKAFSIDLLPEEDRFKLLDKMKEDASSSNANTKRNAEKFWNSLKIARDTLNIQP